MNYTLKKDGELLKLLVDGNLTVCPFNAPNLITIQENPIKGAPPIPVISRLHCGSHCPLFEVLPDTAKHNIVLSCGHSRVLTATMEAKPEPTYTSLHKLPN